MGLLAKARELESLRVTWREYPSAPQPLNRGSAVTDINRATIYFSDSHNKIIYAYQWEAGDWSKLPQCPNSCHTLAIVNGLLTAVGGGQSQERTDALVSLVSEGNNMKWEKHFPPMPTKRRWTTVICCGSHLIVIGGRDEERLTTVEVMDTGAKTWLTACSLPFGLSSATAAIVGDNIYVVGGYGPRDMIRSVLTCSLTAFLQSCQPHPPQSQTPSPWQQVADAPSYLSTCVTVSGELVAVGGCDSDQNPIDAIYAYDPTTNSWNVIGHMNIARARSLTVVLPGDRLMAVGGDTSMYLSCAAVESGTIVY